MIKNRPFKDHSTIKESVAQDRAFDSSEYERPLRIVRSALRAEPRSIEFARSDAHGSSQDSRMRYG